jgi:ATP/maltotriose-dependent transcriptional regulator MalT
MALQRGEFDRAQRLLEESSKDLEATAPALAGWFRFNLPWITMARGDLWQATKELEAVLEFGERSGHENLTVHALTALAPWFALAGEPDRAEDLAAQGIDAARRMGFRRVLVMALVRAAEVATLLERGDRVEALLGEALTHLRNLAGQAWVADAVEMTALALGAGGRHQPATRLLAASEALRSASGETAEAHSTQARVQRYKDEAATHLGRDAFAEEWRQGSQMSRDEMVVQALAELRRSAS